VFSLMPYIRRPSDQQGSKLPRRRVLPLHLPEVQVLRRALTTLPSPLFNRSLASTLLVSGIARATHGTHGNTRMSGSNMYSCLFLHQCVSLTVTQNDIPISNAVANIAWKDGKVVAFGSSFVELDAGIFFLLFLPSLFYSIFLSPIRPIHPNCLSRLAHSLLGNPTG
jgi:hypothetical protein